MNSYKYNNWRPSDYEQANHVAGCSDSQDNGCGAEFQSRCGDDEMDSADDVWEREKCGCKSKYGCKPLPGTIFRLYLPPGTVINFLNLFELVSPTGICLIIRLPFLCDHKDQESLTTLIDSIQKTIQTPPTTVEGLWDMMKTLLASVKEAGGAIEFVK
jgi:hypothetical protein